MPGKYSRLKDSLTSFQAEPEYQQKVNDKRQEIKNTLKGIGEPVNAVNLGRVLVEARLEKKRLETLVKEQNLILAAMEQEIVDFLEDQSMSSLKLTNGVSLSIKDDVYCNVSDKQVFHQWVRDNSLEDLFSVHYQTMASMTKQCLLDGKEVPPGITPYFKQGVMVRGIKDLNGDE